MNWMATAKWKYNSICDIVHAIDMSKSRRTKQMNSAAVMKFALPAIKAISIFLPRFPPAQRKRINRVWWRRRLMCECDAAVTAISFRVSIYDTFLAYEYTIFMLSSSRCGRGWKLYGIHTEWRQEVTQKCLGVTNALCGTCDGWTTQ